MYLNADAFAFDPISGQGSSFELNNTVDPELSEPYLRYRISLDNQEVWIIEGVFAIKLWGT